MKFPNPVLFLTFELSVFIINLHAFSYSMLIASHLMYLMHVFPTL